MPGNEPPYTSELDNCICNLIDPMTSRVMGSGDTPISPVGNISRFSEEVCLHQSYSKGGGRARLPLLPLRLLTSSLCCLQMVDHPQMFYTGLNTQSALSAGIHQMLWKQEWARLLSTRGIRQDFLEEVAVEPSRDCQKGN